MFNVLLDEMPTTWEENGISYEVNTDFRIGVQIVLAQEDPELTAEEKTDVVISLLFNDNVPANYMACLDWFVSGWYTDKPSRKKEKDRVQDFNNDQWRIYAAFLQQYNINLSTVEYMHFWEFMGLLSSLEDCVYNRVIGIRRKKFKPKMDEEERRELSDAKEVYKLEQTRSYEEKEEDDEVYDLLGGNLDYSDEEQERIDEFMSFAEEDD